ncbi:MAG TPA: FtsX-like permease family protein, partial [Vicinamibacterales bacterium]|nr:FtsX-like permease family protein [Vicinamibacterales bacterium]
EAWHRRFGGGPDVLGRRISLNETTWSIVGVLPPAFDFVGTSPPEFVLPWGNTPVSARTVGNHFMRGIGRLKPGVPLEAARLDSDPHIRGASKPEEKQARLVTLTDDQLGSSRQPLSILLGAAGLVLLIACANVAGLLLGNAESRRHEVAVRAALGASRRQIALQLFGESVVLAFLAAAAGVVLAAWFTPFLVSLAPTELPRLATVGVSIRMCGFAALAGIATALLFGTVPALALSSVDPARSLREGGRDAGAGRRRAQRVLVASEVALAVVLVAVSSLLGETVFRLTSQPLGFNPDNLLVASLRMPRDPALTAERRIARTENLVSVLASLPGAIEATATSTAPFSGSYGSNNIQIEGKTFERDPEANRHIVTERYFQTLGIPIVKGRGFEPADRPGTHVAVVTEEFERRYLDGDAIGKRFVLNDDPHLVVGVVRATKHREFSDEASPAFYALHRQLPGWGIGTYVVRTATPSSAMIAAVRKAIEISEPLSSIVTLDTMAAMMKRSVAEERFRAQLALIFGGISLMLAAVGLYALLARNVADRRREIGVRMALGARRGNVVWLILGQALWLVASGLAVGVPAALAASQVVASLLFGVTPSSPHTFGVVALVLMGAALAATLLPARRAARIDPVLALRGD